MSVLRIMDHNGDTEAKWDIDNAVSVKKAKREFDDALFYKRYQAFRIDGPGGGELIREFDPKAETIVMNAPLIGG